MSTLKKIGGSAGASLEEIKGYLSSKMDKVPDMESIKTWLNDAVDKGIVTLSGGKYKLKDAKEYVQQASQAISSKISGSKDKIKDSAGNAEDAEEKEETERKKEAKEKEETAKSSTSNDEKK